MEKRWNILTTPKDITNPINEVLTKRGIRNIDRFLNPSIEYEYPFNRLLNMDKAIETTLGAVKNKAKILVDFDVDTDGVSAGTMVYRYLKDMCNVDYIIGKGKTHGLKQFDFELLLEYDLIIACDSLSNESVLYEELLKQNTQVICLDHHNAYKYSKHAIVVNSEMGKYPNNSLSGSGVCYKFLQGLDAQLGTQNAENYIDLAAVGIIADVMDMSVLENRSICQRGLNNPSNIAIQEIIKGYMFNSQSVSFSIAPLVNSCMRTSNNELAVKLFLSDDVKEVRKLIKEVKLVKEQQDAQVAECMNDLTFNINSEGVDGKKVIFGSISEGDTAGLTATKIANMYCRPAIILKDEVEEIDDKFYLMGSMRSFGGVNFQELINNTGLATASGHEYAAGFQIETSNLKQFKEAIEDSLKDVEFEITENADFEINANQVTLELIEKIQDVNKLTGSGFKPIKCVIRNLMPETFMVMKGKHLKFDTNGITFLMWNNIELADDIRSRKYWGVSVLGELSIGNFRGRKSSNMIITDYVMLSDLAFSLD